MKTYWAAGKGVVVTSANLSINALGAGNLSEVGVLLPASAVNIDRIIATVHPRPVTQAEMNHLDKAHKRFHTGSARFRERLRPISFCEWHDLPYRPKWKSDTPRKAGGLMSGAASKAVTR
jgi:phosphatidylserine/phosphatidylglycerophosphate/cardiolipin synthase-like enzyme